VAQWAPLGWVDPGDLWEVLQEAQEDLQGQCFRPDIDLMVQDQVDPLEAQIVGVHQVAGPQVHLEMPHGKMEVVLVVGQAHEVLEDPLIAGRRLLAWGGGDYLHGALLEVLGLFPHLEDGEEDLQGSGDHQEDHLELPGLPHRMEQTNRETTTWQKSSLCLLRLPLHPRVRYPRLLQGHLARPYVQDLFSRLGHMPLSFVQARFINEGL